MKKKVYFINENVRLTNKSNGIVEGGLSRNIAMMKWLRKNVTNLCDIKLSNNPYINILIVYYILITRKRSIIFFQYITVGVPLMNPSFLGRTASRLFILLVKKSLKKNDVIFDISDLKLEQSSDMGFHNDRLEWIAQVEQMLFRLNAKFIFASYEMQKYACAKYSINSNKTEVVINGGNLCKNILNSDVNSDSINFVYAGTLNRGRSIEEMINSFPDIDGIHLYLLGSKGSWIKNFIKSSNITYIGELTESKAQEFICSCDIGLIPYDYSIRYFNIAYPTKLSFYITSGIPFLSTPVNEVRRVEKQYNIGYLYEINEWSSFFARVSKSSIELQKNSINTIKYCFEWNFIFSKSNFLGEMVQFGS